MIGGYSTDLGARNPTGGQTDNERQISTNQLLSVADKLGRKTAYAYDGNGNTSTITDPAGNVTRYEYDLTFNKPTKITDALGNVTTMVYDAKGNLVSITDPMGKTTAISYNANGKPITITDALGNITRFEYDGYGNLIKTTDPLGDSAQMEYDFIGRLIKAVDAKGKSTSYSYDLANRITEITDALSGKTKFTYDKNGNLLAVTDAKNQVISYEYDERDRAKKMIDQLGKMETYSYDKMDNLVSVKNRKDQATTYSYDLLSRLTKTLYGDSSFTNYTYDAIGRLTYIGDSVSGAISYAYSNSGCSACGSRVADKIIQEVTSFGMISYEYDVLRRRTKAQVAGQEPVYYFYDANSRLIKITQGDKSVLINYDSIGRRTSMTLPNGIIANYNYDAASRLLNITYYSGSQILKSIDYTHDKNSNRTSAKGHKTLLPEPFAATYNSANQMITFNGQPLTYDNNGNLVSKGDTTYQWDARNRLTAITNPAYNASFKYDAFGRRIEKTINGKTIDYLYNGWDIVQEIEDGTVATNYLRSLNIDETFGIFRQDGVYYYLTDALGSTIALTDPLRNIATEYYYDPFGNTQTSSPNIYNPFQYTGRENDGNGHYGYRARELLTNLHRFASEDPIGLKGGINKFSYVGNNPINKIDPLGLDDLDPDDIPSPGHLEPNPNGLICSVVCGLGTKLMCWSLSGGLGIATGGPGASVFFPCSVTTTVACQTICPDPVKRPECPK